MMQTYQDRVGMHYLCHSHLGMGLHRHRQTSEPGSSSSTNKKMASFVGKRCASFLVDRGSSSPAFEITEDDLLARDDELSAIFDYVLGQSNKLFTSNITSTKGAGIREPGCTLVEMVDLQLAPAPVVLPTKNKKK
jgi:hypothetical protein